MDRIAAALGHALEVGAGAEGPVPALEHGDVEVGIGVEGLEGVVQRLGRGAVDGVAGLGTLDGDDGRAAADLDADGGPGRLRPFGNRERSRS
jgi:hypothetical protein